MLCPNCRMENEENAVFCQRCGNPMEEPQSALEHLGTEDDFQEPETKETEGLACNVALEEEEPFFDEGDPTTSENFYSLEGGILPETERKKSFWHNKKKRNILLGSLIGVLVISAAVFVGMNHAYLECRLAILAHKNNKMIEVYQKNMEDKRFVKQMKRFSTEQANKAYKSYKNNHSSFTEAKKTMETYGYFIDVSMYEEDLETIDTSRHYYQEGENYARQGDMLNAAIAYQKVNPLDDKNYSSSSIYFQINMSQIASKAVSKLETFQNTGDFKGGNEFIESIRPVLEENDFFLKKAYRFWAEMAQSGQDVRVAETKIINQQYWGYDLLSVSFQNVSKKSVKYMEAIILGFDKNKNPVKIKTERQGEGQYVLWGTSEEVIKAGTTTGEHSGWRAYNAGEIAYLYACPYKVTFSDGETWENPYADYFYEVYAGKKLEE